MQTGRPFFIPSSLTSISSLLSFFLDKKVLILQIYHTFADINFTKLDV